MAAPVLLSAMGNRELGSSRHPTRNVPRNRIRQQDGQLEHGDSVIFLSDGFCEAQNSEGEFFGIESVLEVCESSWEIRRRRFCSN